MISVIEPSNGCTILKDVDQIGALYGDVGAQHNVINL